MIFPQNNNRVTNHKPDWLKPEELPTGAPVVSQIVKTASVNTIAVSYVCNSCHTVTSADKIKAVAHLGNLCPKCGSVVEVYNSTQKTANIDNRHSALISKQSDLQHDSSTYNTFLDRHMVYRAINELAHYASKQGLQMAQARYIKSEHTKTASGTTSMLNNITCELSWKTGLRTTAKAYAVISVDDAGQYVYPKIITTANGREYAFEKKALLGMPATHEHTPVERHPKKSDTPTFKRSDPSRFKSASKECINSAKEELTLAYEDGKAAFEDAILDIKDSGSCDELDLATIGKWAITQFPDCTDCIKEHLYNLEKTALLEAMAGSSSTDESGVERTFNDEGQLHSEDNWPAVYHPNGYRAWYKNDKLHNSEGPAVVYPDGRIRYYVDGKPVSEEEHTKQMFASIPKRANFEISNDTKLYHNIFNIHSIDDRVLDLMSKDIKTLGKQVAFKDVEKALTTQQNTFNDLRTAFESDFKRAGLFVDITDNKGKMCLIASNKPISEDNRRQVIEDLENLDDAVDFGDESLDKAASLSILARLYEEYEFTHLVDKFKNTTLGEDACESNDYKTVADAWDNFILSGQGGIVDEDLYNVPEAWRAVWERVRNTCNKVASATINTNNIAIPPTSPTSYNVTEVNNGDATVQDTSNNKQYIVPSNLIQKQASLNPVLRATADAKQKVGPTGHTSVNNVPMAEGKNIEVGMTEFPYGEQRGKGKGYNLAFDEMDNNFEQDHEQSNNIGKLPIYRVPAEKIQETMKTSSIVTAADFASNIVEDVETSKPLVEKPVMHKELKKAPAAESFEEAMVIPMASGGVKEAITKFRNVQVEISELKADLKEKKAPLEAQLKNISTPAEAEIKDKEKLLKSYLDMAYSRLREADSSIAAYADQIYAAHEYEKDDITSTVTLPQIIKKAEELVPEIVEHIHKLKALLESERTVSTINKILYEYPVSVQQKKKITTSVDELDTLIDDLKNWVSTFTDIVDQLDGE